MHAFERLSQAGQEVREGILISQEIGEFREETLRVNRS
jgi:hypothetical protein